MLAQGKALRRLRAAERGDQPLTDEAHEYLRASKRRNARRRTFALLGTLVIVTAVGFARSVSSAESTAVSTPLTGRRRSTTSRRPARWIP